MPFGDRSVPRPCLCSSLHCAWETFVTTDEELNVLDSQLRRLKIEYEIYFSNPTKRPPTDVEWKVLSLLRQILPTASA